MTELDYILLAIVLVALWWVGLLYLNRRGFLEPRKLSLIGPILMWKTQKGRDLIDRIARRKRLWRVFGDLSIVLVGVAMIATTALLVWEASLVQSPAVRANPPSPDLLLGLPGINRLIPLGYGIFGLAVAIILHEFSHGILSRVSNIKIRSLGGIFMIVPIGAFVEPDEDELRALPRRERARLYSAGPATNLVLAILFAVLFSSMVMTSVAPVHDGVGIVGFTEDSSPARLANMQAYTIITEINGTPVRTYGEFVDALSLVQVNVTISVAAYNPANGEVTRYDVTPVERNPSTGRALLGIYAFDLSTDYYHPLTNPDKFGGVPRAILAYISLPFSGYAPIQDPATRFYQIQGPLALLPEGFFWILANALYWLFWLNAMLGATNALPAVPLDGGYVFRDGLESIVVRLRKGMRTEDRDRIVRQVTNLSALLILALIVWQLIGPRI